MAFQSILNTEYVIECHTLYDIYSRVGVQGTGAFCVEW